MANSKLVTLISALVLISLLPSRAAAQVTEQQTSSGNTRRFSYNITSNYGVSITSSSSPGYDLNATAEMGILPGSSVRNAAGTGTVTISENGLSVSGLEGGLYLNLDPDKTLFKASLTNSNPNRPEDVTSTGQDGVSLESDSAGTASITSSGFATTSITAEMSESFQTRTFEKSF